MRVLLLILSIVVFQQFATAQVQLRRDSSRMTARTFIPERISDFKSDPAYKYDRIIERPASLWDRFWGWFWEKAGSVLRNKTGKRVVITVLVLLAICTLVFFILKLNGMTRTSLFGTDMVNGPAQKLQDDIHAIDFESAIREAAGNNNFRLAVRLLYLQSIKYMADRGLIDWQFNKTNTQYVQELRGSGHERAFDELTFQFEKSWYGDVPVEDAEYASVRDKFEQFNRQIQ